MGKVFKLPMRNTITEDEGEAPKSNYTMEHIFPVGGKTKVAEVGRRCEKCRRLLSMYNRSDTCHACKISDHDIK